MENLVETSVSVQTVDSFIDRLIERGTCLGSGCDTPVTNMKIRHIHGHDIYVCPDCGSVTTSRYTVSNVPDPDRNRLKVNWVVK